MKRIGEIACRLVANPVELVAAANQKRGTEFDSGPSEARTTNEPQRHDTTEVRATGMGKKARLVESPASSDREELHQAGEEIGAGDTYGTQMRPALRLVMGGRGMDGATHRRNRGCPSPASSRPMLLVVGGVHARTVP